jgi:dTDP-glucose 4,6-dehydratase
MGTTLVTGGAGFIGSHFVERLYRKKPDEKIIVLDALTYAGNLENIPQDIRADVRRFDFVMGNVTDSALVNHLIAHCDRVVHFAAESHVTRSISDERIFFDTNVMGTETVASAIASRKGTIANFVHISTSEVYGTHSTPTLPTMREDHPLLPRSPYAASKAAADRLVYSYRATYGIPLVIVRPFNNYGPRQHLEKVIPRFITSALLGQPLEVHGDGKMTRDWIYVEDTADAVLKALFISPDKMPSDPVINVGTGKDISIMDIARAVVALVPSEKRSPIVHIADRPGRVDRHISSVQVASSLLDFATTIRFADGLKRAIEWYRENPDRWLPGAASASTDITDSNRGLEGAF